MVGFIFSQIIGLCLFLTLNYGILSYVNYRKNQAEGKVEKRTERFILQQVRIAVSLFIVIGIAYRISVINEYFKIDYGLIFFKAIFPEAPIDIYLL